MLVFFVVSGEKRITKQMFLGLCGYFFLESHHFLRFVKGAGVSPRACLHTAYRYNPKHIGTILSVSVPS